MRDHKMKEQSKGRNGINTIHAFDGSKFK